MNEVKTVKVYDPFHDDYVDLICTFEISVDRKGKLIGASITSMVAESGIELLGYLNEENIPAEVEANFVEAYNG